MDEALAELNAAVESFDELTELEAQQTAQLKLDRKADEAVLVESTLSGAKPAPKLQAHKTHTALEETQARKAALWQRMERLERDTSKVLRANHAALVAAGDALLAEAKAKELEVLRKLRQADEARLVALAFRNWAVKTERGGLHSLGSRAASDLRDELDAIEQATS